jgi:hypothetical protein
MANYNNYTVTGVSGGLEGAYGMERMMGRSDTPVQRILN